VKELMGAGIRPDILLCRADREIEQDERKKIALFCNIDYKKVIPALDVENIYQVPQTYHREGLDRQIMDSFGIKDVETLDLSTWDNIVKRIKAPEGEVRIAIVGKYTNLTDSYKSLNEALIHGGIANNVRVNLEFIESEIFEREDPASYLHRVHGILVPGGFGERGAEGKIKPPSNLRANGRFRISESASACRWRLSKRREISRVLKKPVRRNSVSARIRLSA
jgi:CTP synthase